LNIGGAAHAIQPRDVAGGGDDAAYPAADDDRPGGKFGPVTLLDAGVEGVAVDVGDGQREQLGMADDAGAVAGGAASGFGHGQTVAAEGGHLPTVRP
jgi:hypothetical protein